MDAIPSLRRVVRARWIIFALASAVSAAGSDALSGARHQNSAELAELARQHEESDLGRAWDYAEQARVAAQTPREQLAAELRRGVIQRRSGDYTEALATTRA